MGHSCISKGLMEKWSEDMGAGGLERLFMGHPGDPQMTPRPLLLSPTTGLHSQATYHIAWYAMKMKNE